MPPSPDMTSHLGEPGGQFIVTAKEEGVTGHEAQERKKYSRESGGRQLKRFSKPPEQPSGRTCRNKSDDKKP